MADTQVRPEVQTWMDTIHGGDIELYKVVADRLTHLGVATDPAVQKAIGAALRQWYADQMQQLIAAEETYVFVPGNRESQKRR
jgi:hypothetical protein